MNKKPEGRPLGSPDWILIGAVIALALLGLMMVYSSTFDLGYRMVRDSAYFLKRQAAFTAIGFVAMLIVARIPYRHWTKLSIPIMAGAVLMLLAQVVFGTGRQLFGESGSPVELAKLAVVVYISHWLASKGDQLRKLPYGLLPFTIMVGVIAGLVMAQPDISEALLIVLVAVAMFFLAGADVLQFAIGIIGGGAAFALVVSRIPQAMERLQPFLLEWRDPLNSTNTQLVRGLLALGSGGLLGMGPGNGRMKYQWLQAAHTDSIFAIVGEELGFVGCLAVILLFAVVAYRGFLLVRRAPDSFGRLLASGVTCWIVFQAAINMAVVTGTIPFTGIALPFISVGGTAMITYLIGVGILLNVARAANAQPIAGAVPDAAADRQSASSAPRGTRESRAPELEQGRP